MRRRVVVMAGGPAIPGTPYAFQVVAPESPVLRVRYRNDLAVDPHGFPDWVPYARALVQLPPCPPGLGDTAGPGGVRRRAPAATDTEATREPRPMIA
jgi:hypothetical protein